jgi:hypothetical protein
MDNKISILFYSRIALRNKNNLAPIYLRITIDGKRIEQSINRTVELSKWSNKAGKMKGSHAEARAFNSFLDAIRNKVHSAEREMIQDGKAITYQTFKEKWLGTNEKQYMLIEIFTQHNSQLRELVGKDFARNFTTLPNIKTSH